MEPTEQLLQEVTEILEQQGIHTTPQQLKQWAKTMVQKKKDKGKHTDENQWIASLKHNYEIPTILLKKHLQEINEPTLRNNSPIQTPLQ